MMKKERQDQRAVESQSGVILILKWRQRRIGQRQISKRKRKKRPKRICRLLGVVLGGGFVVDECARDESVLSLAHRLRLLDPLCRHHCVQRTLQMRKKRQTRTRMKKRKKKKKKKKKKKDRIRRHLDDGVRSRHHRRPNGAEQSGAVDIAPNKQKVFS